MDDTVKRRFPKLAPTRWNYSSRLVKTVLDCKEDLIQLFEYIKETPKNFDPKSINESHGFLHALKSFDFNILLLTFSAIFPFTEYLFNIFQSKSMDISFCSREVENIISEFEKLRSTQFNEIWDLTVRKCGLPAFRKTSHCLGPQLQYKSLFFEVLDTIIVQMKQRFSCLKEMKFVELLDCKRFSEYNKMGMFPENCLDSLQKSYGSRFDFSCLKSQLVVLYSLNNFRKDSVEELHKFMYEEKLYEGFSEVYKLILLILTIPYSTSSVERSFSALKRIKTYLRNKQGQSRLSSLALMSIEKSFLKKMMSQAEVFYNTVIDHFCKKSRRVELLFK